MTTSAHYFYAVKIPTEIKQGLGALCEELKHDWAFHKWVHPMDFHITLAFLGSAPEDKLNLAQELMKQAIEGDHVFSLHMTDIGSFGRKESPRILWIDVNKEEKLHLLRGKVFNACNEAGFQLETRPFTPHITVARKWIDKNAFSPEVSDVIKGKLMELQFSVSEVVLYKTNLAKSPKYEIITTYPLVKE